MLRFTYNIMTGMTYWFEPDAYTKKQDMKKLKKYKR